MVEGLDDDVAAWLAVVVAAGAPPLSSLSPTAARAAYAAGPKPPGDAVARVADTSIGGVPVRTYAVDEAAAAPGAPAVAFFHGGGFVVSSVDGHDSLARRLATRTGVLVVSVDYRLAPEHPFPAPADDCFAVTRALVDEGRTVAVVGDSAGGNLAASVALRARDEGVPLALQVLVYPCLDPAGDTASWTENGRGRFLDADDMRWFWDQYLRDGSQDDPRAAPARADDLRGLAPTLVQTAQFDILRDEAEAYAERLAAAGVEVTCTRYPGVVHGFVSRWDRMARAHAAIDEIAAAVRRAFGRG